MNWSKLGRTPLSGSRVSTTFSISLSAPHALRKATTSEGLPLPRPAQSSSRYSMRFIHLCFWMVSRGILSGSRASLLRSVTIIWVRPSFAQPRPGSPLPTERPVLRPSYGLGAATQSRVRLSGGLPRRLDAQALRWSVLGSSLRPEHSQPSAVGAIALAQLPDRAAAVVL